MSKSTCIVENCNKPSRARKMCVKHYNRFMVHGTTESKTPRHATPEDAFAARTRLVDSGCIEWTGAKSCGYGNIWVDGRNTKAHRYAWERINGPIPEGLLIDHMCFNRACVNVEHLRLATQGENQQNLQGARAKGSSGIRGVYFHKLTNKWQAQIQVSGKPYYGGLHATRDEAARVAEALRAKYMPYSQN